MTLHIIVPVKRLSEAKSRLAAVLEEGERYALALSFLRQVLEVVRQAQLRIPARGVVISVDPEVLKLAADYGLHPLRETLGVRQGLSVLQRTDNPLSSPRERGEVALNAALEQATAWAARQQASAVLILPADLPFLRLADVEHLWRTSQQLYSARAMVIVPDAREQGTNALLVRPPGALHYQFGPDSFHRHCAQARTLGMAWHVQRLARLGLDVDLPADLERYLALERADMGTSDFRENEMTALVDSQTEAFLNQPGLLMRLGTIGRDGYPQVTPVWYLYEAGRFYVTTASDRVKARNMLANPKVGFAIDSDVKPYQGLSVRGRARLVAEGEAARELTRRIAARYVPAKRLETMVETLMQAPRVVFAIEPVRVVKMGSWN